MVFVVNMLSPNTCQVNIEKTNMPMLDPMNLADQADPEAAVILLQANQKNMLVGKPNRTADKNGLSFHHSDMFCRLSWNQPNA